MTKQNRKRTRLRGDRVHGADTLDSWLSTWMRLKWKGKSTSTGEGPSKFQRLARSGDVRVKLPSAVYVALLYVPPHPVAAVRVGSFRPIAITSCAQVDPRCRIADSIDNLVGTRSTKQVHRELEFSPSRWQTPINLLRWKNARTHVENFFPQNFASRFLENFQLVRDEIYWK